MRAAELFAAWEDGEGPHGLWLEKRQTLLNFITREVEAFRGKEPFEVEATARAKEWRCESSEKGSPWVGMEKRMSGKITETRGLGTKLFACLFPALHSVSSRRAETVSQLPWLHTGHLPGTVYPCSNPCRETRRNTAPSSGECAP